MGAIKLKGFAVEGKLTVVVPEELNGQELEITIDIPENVSINRNDWATLPSHERIKILKKFAGTAKYPNAETNKYDVYDQ